MAFGLDSLARIFADRGVGRADSLVGISPEFGVAHVAQDAFEAASTEVPQNLNMPRLDGLSLSPEESAAAVLPVEDDVIATRDELRGKISDITTKLNSVNVAAGDVLRDDAATQMFFEMIGLAVGDSAVDLASVAPTSGNIQHWDAELKKGQVSIDWSRAGKSDPLAAQKDLSAPQLKLFLNRMRVFWSALCGDTASLVAPQQAQAEKPGGSVRPGNAILESQAREICVFLRSIILEHPGFLQFLPAQICLTPLGNTDLVKGKYPEKITPATTMLAWMYNALIDEDFAAQQPAWQLMDPIMRLASLIEFKAEHGVKAGGVNIGWILQGEMTRTDFKSFAKLDPREFLIAFVTNLVKILGTVPGMTGIVPTINRTSYTMLKAYFNVAMSYYQGEVTDLDEAYHLFIREIGLAIGVNVDDPVQGQENRAIVNMAMMSQDLDPEAGARYRAILQQLDQTEAAVLIAELAHAPGTHENPEMRAYLLPSQVVMAVKMIKAADATMSDEAARTIAWKLVAKGLKAARLMMDGNSSEYARFVSDGVVNIRFDSLVGSKVGEQSDADFGKDLIQRAQDSHLKAQLRIGKNGPEIFWP